MTMTDEDDIFAHGLSCSDPAASSSDQPPPLIRALKANKITGSSLPAQNVALFLQALYLPYGGRKQTCTSSHCRSLVHLLIADVENYGVVDEPCFVFIGLLI